MKRILFFLMLGAAITGCNKNAEKTESAENESIAKDSTAAEKATAKMAGNDPDCRDFTEYDRINNLSDQVEWLKKYGAEVCPELLRVRPRIEHEVDPSIFTNRQGTIPITRTWAQIKDLIGNDVYENYITFDIDANHNITDVKTTDKFSTYPFCFSMPLFRSIGEYMQLTDESEFTFIPANRNVSNAVYFKVVKKDNLGNQVGDAAYFDLSDNPKSQKGRRRILSPL